MSTHDCTGGKALVRSSLAALALAEGAGFGFRKISDSCSPGKRLTQISASDALPTADLRLLVAIYNRARDEDPWVL